LGIQFGKALGYHVVGIDNRDSSLDVIKSLNCCDLIVDARKESTAEVFKKCNNGLGCHAVLILPESQKAFDYAAPLARKAGTVCIVSFPKNGFNISSNEVVFRDVRIRGMLLRIYKLIVGTLLGTTKDAAEMFDIFVKNKLKVIKTVFTLDQVNELVKAYESGSVAGKLVVKV
jgi:D-arabinose 1-dehydrogenase-like Zn-dependent alcohol dehydrogenase